MQVERIAKRLNIPYGGKLVRAEPTDEANVEVGRAPDVPEELYDGWAVYRELDERAKQRTSVDNISDVLDAVVRLIKKREDGGRQT